MEADLQDSASRDLPKKGFVFQRKRGVFGSGPHELQNCNWIGPFSPLQVRHLQSLASNQETTSPNHKKQADSMKTPITDEAAKQSEKWPALSAYKHMYDTAANLEREVIKWKERFVTFAIMHAAIYGRDHYGDGCLHWTHYDMLKEAGARMDDFKRCGQS